MEGWVCIHRQIMEHPDYFAEPFTRMGAWIDLLLLANHKRDSITVRHQVVSVERGQIGISEDTLAARWQWSRGKVRRFLKKLEDDGQIVQQKSNVIGCITVVNYGKYQYGSTADKRQEGFSEGYSLGYCGGGTTESEKTVQQRIVPKVQQKNDTINCLSDINSNVTASSGTTKKQLNSTTENAKTVHKQQYNNNTHTVVSNNNLVTDKMRARAKRTLEWVAANFPDVAAMPKPFTEEQAMVLLGKYSEEDIMRIISDMHNKGATGNMSAYASFNAFAERDTLLTRRREDQTKLYTYDEVCTAVTRGLRFDDFTITGTKRHGQNLWRRRQDGS